MHIPRRLSFVIVAHLPFSTSNWQDRRQNWILRRDIRVIGRSSFGLHDEWKLQRTCPRRKNIKKSWRRMIVQAQSCITKMLRSPSIALEMKSVLMQEMRTKCWCCAWHLRDHTKQCEWAARCEGLSTFHTEQPCALRLPAQANIDRHIHFKTQTKEHNCANIKRLWQILQVSVCRWNTHQKKAR